MEVRTVRKKDLSQSFPLTGQRFIAKKSLAQAERAWFEQAEGERESEAERERSAIAGGGHSVFSCGKAEPLFSGGFDYLANKIMPNKITKIPNT